METSEELEFTLSADDPKTLFVPAKIAHAFYNNSDKNQFMLLAYSSELFDPADTIAYVF
jgi:dTDP-4-dehydrorhamnose 3,5-epimerase-like enzyme